MKILQVQSVQLSNTIYCLLHNSNAKAVRYVTAKAVRYVTLINLEPASQGLAKSLIIPNLIREYNVLLILLAWQISQNSFLAIQR